MKFIAGHRCDWDTSDLITLGVMPSIVDSLGPWSGGVISTLGQEELIPPARDLDAWAVLTHHLHAETLDQPTLFPWRREHRSLDLRRLARLADSRSPTERSSYQLAVPYPTPRARRFRFIDLFAGIGGFRIALQQLGGRCVLSSEWDRSARLTYARNFGDVPLGDVRRITRSGGRFRPTRIIDRLVPDCEVITGGFPCQPFSIAGISSRRHHGLETGRACPDQGTLFDDIIAIVRAKREHGAGPRVVFLENVRNLRTHDSGRTFAIIESRLSALGYVLTSQVVDSQAVVPQRRKRIYLVAVRSDLVDSMGEFRFPRFTIPDPPLALSSILEPEADVGDYQISSRLWASHRRRARHHRDRGNGFTVEIADTRRPANTLVSRYYKDGKDCLISMGRGRNPRMLTPRECARLQGFDPERFQLPAARTPAYRQFGNSVTVPIVRTIARSFIDYLD